MIFNKNFIFCSYTLLIFFLYPCSSFPQFIESDFKTCSKAAFYYGNPQLLPYPESDSTIIVSYYDLRLDIQSKPDLISGTAELYIRKKTFPENIFFLNLSSLLFIDSVKINEITVNYIHQNDKLTVLGWNNLIPDSVYKIKIIYGGLPVPTGFGSFVFGSHLSSPVIWSLSQPYGSQDWFPCKNSIYDKADSSQVSITCSENLTGVSNGILINTINNQNGTKKYIWKNSYPISVYLISVAVSDYYEYKNYYKYSQNDSLEIVHYVYPEMFAGLKGQLDKTPGMIDIFTEKFGEYPFIREKYGHAQANISGAMEHQTITTIGVFTDGVIAHELAHQWFGDKITCRDWHHIWLNEGFATYSEGIYIESMLGKQSYNEFVRMKMSDSKQAQGTLYVQNIDLISEIFNGYRSYSKGSIVLHMLRGVVGDSTFFKILRSYVNDTALSYGVASTEDFQRICETESEMELDYFFNQWIYGENFPKYIIEWSYEKGNETFYDIKVKIIQKANTNPSFFTMPVEIQVKTDICDTVVRIFNDSLIQNYNFSVKGKPESLKFDPDDKILKEKTGDDIYEKISYLLYQNYPNPFNPKTTIEYEIYKYDNVKLSIYDIRGREVTVLVNEKQRPGFYKIVFIPQDLSSGVYFYRLISGNFNDTKKLVYLK
ncbi:MAG: T9SS type A sorting domain-containing protein [Ignavibacteria bacterium]|nr:T9SS type A sorting domain-containing protein [Ignavibacteria bacterium]